MRFAPGPRRALSALLGDDPLVYVDCGARAGRIPQPFRSLKHAQYIGIDADTEECARLNAVARRGHRYLPAVLGRATGRRTFYVTHNPSCASLLQPNQSLLEEFPLIAGYFSVDRQVEVDTTSLDACLAADGVRYVDCLELDTQGTELELLEGADGLLRQSVLCVQTEVEFASMYLDQPLFADVDAFLRARGFALYDLSRYHVSRAAAGKSVATRGQLLWGQALYLRDHRSTPSDTLSARLAVIAALLHLPDLAFRILHRLSKDAREIGLQNVARAASDALLASTTEGLLARMMNLLDVIRRPAAKPFLAGSGARSGMAVRRD